MKFKLFLPICLAIVLVGCSSDDESTPMPEESNSNYFPLVTGNSWTYNNERSVDGQTEESQENLTITDSTEESGITYYNLNSDNPLGGGLVTGIFANGTLAKINGELLYNGTYQVNLPGFDPIELPIDAAAVFSSTADAGTELSNFSHSVEQDIVVQGQTIPVSINYTVSTTNEAFLPTYSAGGEEFEDVLQANLLVTASVTANVGPIEVDLLAEQEVVTISNYYANGVGLIFSDATINYEFEDLSSFGVPNIPNIHVELSQEIDVYVVTLE